MLVKTKLKQLLVITSGGVDVSTNATKLSTSDEGVGRETDIPGSRHAEHRSFETPP